MQIDEEWCTWQDRGFTWWGHECAQRVWSEPGYDDEGIAIHRLHAQADLVADVDVTPRVLEALNAFNTLVVLSALHADGHQGKVSYRVSMWVHEQSMDWVAHLFKLVVAIQAAHANAQAELLAPLLEGKPDKTSHPSSGSRSAADEMLLINEQIVVPAGVAPSVWAGSEMADLSERWVSRFCVLGNGDETGLTQEFPFPGGTSLLQVTTEEPHPALGNGMLMRLSLPERVSEAEGPGWANAMNSNELVSLTRSNFVGSWTVVNGTPTFVSFYPNAARLSDGLLTNLVINATSRSRWVAYDRGDNWERPGRIDAAREQKLKELRNMGDS